MVISFMEIVVMVLATSGGKRFEQFERRLVPIQETWGALFPHLYFLMGRSEQDLSFVSGECELQRQWLTPEGEEQSWAALKSTAGRSLAPHARQGPYKSEMDVYNCKSNAKHRNDDRKRIRNDTKLRVVMTHRCTGEYFGAGPTCRSEEGLLAFLHWPEFQTAKWLIFMDDDVYLRPFAMRSFLTHLPAGNTAAISFTDKKRGLQYAKKRVKGLYNCSDLDIAGFYFAQPSVLSRGALEAMKPSLNRRGMRKLQLYWGGSHDAILGLFLYLHKIPIWSLAKGYVGHPVAVNSYEKMLRAFDEKRHFVFHKVRNAKQGKRRIASQYDLRDLFGDDTDDPEAIARQELIGLNAAESAEQLIMADPSRLRSFSESRPEDFNKDMCQL